MPVRGRPQMMIGRSISTVVDLRVAAEEVLDEQPVLEVLRELGVGC